MEIAVIGVNHFSAPIEMREQLVFSDLKKIEILNQLLDEGIPEAIVLATCNRSEIYIAAPHIVDEMDKVMKVYHSFAQSEEVMPYLFVKVREEAIKHLYHVAAGLDSIVLGEDQILGQVKEALALAMELGASKKVLNKCFREAVTTAKHIKTTTQISTYPLSMSSIAVKLLKEKLGTLEGKKGLLIGVGKMGELALNHLYEAKVGTVYVANRTGKKSEAIQAKYPYITPVTYEARYEVIRQVDFIVTATASPHLVLRKQEMPSVQHPLFIVDIALPRDVEAAIGHMPHVSLYDMDTLKEVVDNNLTRRNDLAKQAETIITSASRELIAWLRTMKTEETMQVLYARCEAIQDDTMTFLKRKGDLSARQEKMIEKMLISALRRMVREPIHQLKEIEDSVKQEQYIAMMEELFKL